MKSRTRAPSRWTMYAPTRQPSRIPPQTPSPPSQTAKIPFHFGLETSSQLVMSWYARAPTMPAATPQTATLRTRSQSPPRRVQRTPVSQMHAAIASSSIRPYMWIVSGPRSIVPVCGEGMEARITGATFCPRPGTPACCREVLDEDLDRRLVRTALLDQLDREVQVDVVPGRQGEGVARFVAGTDELLGSPVL